MKADVEVEIVALQGAGIAPNGGGFLKDHGTREEPSHGQSHDSGSEDDNLRIAHAIRIAKGTLPVKPLW